MIILRDAFRSLNAAFDFVVDSAFYAAAGLIMFLALSVGYEVLMRRVFNNPTSWVLQTAEYTLVFITMLSATKILKEEGHTRMTVVLEYLPPRVVATLHTITSFVSAIVTAIITWRTGLSSIQAYDFGTIYRGGYEIPQYWLWWVMPFGFGLLTIQFVRMGFQFLPIARGQEEASETETAPGEAQAHLGE